MRFIRVIIIDSFDLRIDVFINSFSVLCNLSIKFSKSESEKGVDCAADGNSSQGAKCCETRTINVCGALSVSG